MLSLFSKLTILNSPLGCMTSLEPWVHGQVYSTRSEFLSVLKYNHKMVVTMTSVPLFHR